MMWISIFSQLILTWVRTVVNMQIGLKFLLLNRGFYCNFFYGVKQVFGLDGFKNKFFSSGPLLILICHFGYDPWFLLSSIINASLKAYIYLVSKKIDSELVDDFHPISLISCAYKL